MDWIKVIEINKAALVRIVAGLVALLAAQAGAARLPLPIYQSISRVLFPAESAVRRLIVIAAKKLVLPEQSIRAMPPGIVFAGRGRKSRGRVAFQLFDTRKSFTETETPRITGPRIRVVGDDSPQALFLAKFATPRDGLCSTAQTRKLSLRLEAVKRALDTLPRQAQRLLRWQARRAAMQNPKFVRALRPGPPPGNRYRGKDDIDKVLRECHALAWAVLNADTS